MDVISRNVSTHKNGDTMEVDVLLESRGMNNQIFYSSFSMRPSRR
jgi:hypothetical protein